MRREVKVGERFCDVTVVEELAPYKGNSRRFLCKCDCGNEKIIRIDALKIAVCNCINYWSSEEDETLKRTYATNMTSDLLILLPGRTKGAIHSRAERLNLTASNKTSHYEGRRPQKQIKFIDDVAMVHSNFYDYSLVEFKGTGTHVRIICPKHGEFSMTPCSHLLGEGCFKCGRERSANALRKTTNIFVDQATILHGNNYDYSKVDYYNTTTKVIIICPKHGEFSQTPDVHLNHVSGCPECGSPTKNLSTFLVEAKKIHKDRYGYDRVVYITNQIKVIINCKIHGDFEQTTNSHLSGSGCPACKGSKGEDLLRKLFIDNKIGFESQKKFDGCKNPLTNYRLRFDFYLPGCKTLIEFDGMQHFKPWFALSEKAQILFERTLQNDIIKVSYAKNNNLPLIRIAYKNLKKLRTYANNEAVQSIDEVISRLKELSYGPTNHPQL